MKRICTLMVIVLSICLYSQSEWYYVIQVKGKVVTSPSKKPVRAGDKLATTDKIVFREENAVVKVINPDRGIYNLSPSYSGEKKGKEFQYLVKAVLSPLLGATTSVIMTKSLDLNESPFEGVVIAVGDTSGLCQVVFGKHVIKIYPKEDKGVTYSLEFNYNEIVYTSGTYGDGFGMYVVFNSDSLPFKGTEGPLEITGKIVRTLKDSTEIHQRYRFMIPENKGLVNELKTVVEIMEKTGKPEEEVFNALKKSVELNYPGCFIDTGAFSEWLAKKSICPHKTIETKETK